MSQSDADDVIVSRTLDVDGEPRFRLRVFRPVPEDDGSYWRCRYEVDGPLTRHVGSLCGGDSMQALLNVIYILGTEADVSEENLTKRLSWDGQSEHFGFPSINADPVVARLPKHTAPE